MRMGYSKRVNDNYDDRGGGGNEVKCSMMVNICMTPLKCTEKYCGLPSNTTPPSIAQLCHSIYMHI